jgi:hypothetical protein
MMHLNSSTTACIPGNHDVSDAVMNRRTQAFLSDLSDWRQAEMEVQNLKAYGVDKVGASLLISVYQHYRESVEDWLRRLSESIDHPGTMLQRRCNTPGKLSDAPLELDVCLHLTQAPDLPQLRRWLNHRNGQRMTASMKKNNHSTGILVTLLGLIWLP